MNPSNQKVYEVDKERSLSRYAIRGGRAGVEQTAV